MKKAPKYCLDPENFDEYLGTILRAPGSVVVVCAYGAIEYGTNDAQLAALDAALSAVRARLDSILEARRRLGV